MIGPLRRLAGGRCPPPTSAWSPLSARNGRSGARSCAGGRSWTKSTMRPHASHLLLDQMPASPGEILPSGDTQVISVMTRPAPPTARLPRWTRCHSPGMPSTAEYWSIGDTTTRWARSDHELDRGGTSAGRLLGRPSPAPCVRAGVPVVNGFHVRGVTDPEVVVGDTLAAGEHAEDELLRLHAAISVGALEPLETGPGRPLQAADLGAPLAPRTSTAPRGTAGRRRSPRPV